MLHGLVEGAKVLDLFAGSGSYGLEALSRGAEKAVFVDNEKRSVRATRINLKEMGFEGRGVVVKGDALAFAENLSNTKEAGQWPAATSEVAKFTLPSEEAEQAPQLQKKERALKGATSEENKELAGLYSSEGFDLIFLSPPYKMGAQIHLLKYLSNILAPQGLIIFDHDRETEIPEEIKNVQKIRSRSYGATGITILAKKGET